MGNTYEVWGWRETADSTERDIKYEWEFLYAGESWNDALVALNDSDESIYHCVKLEWRRG